VGVNSVEYWTPILENALQGVGIPDQIKALICDTFQWCDNNYPSLGGYSNYVALDHGSFCLY